MRLRDAELLTSMFRKGGDAQIKTDVIEDGVKSPLVTSGILVHDGELDTWEVQDEPCFTPILHDRWDRPFYTDGVKHLLSADEIQLWRLDESRFAEILAEAFDCTDNIREVVPGVLWNLGHSSETLGRFNMREVYFAPRVESCESAALSHLPKDAKSYILVAGWMKPGREFDSEFLQHAFQFSEAVDLNDNGEWEVCRERIDQRFAPEVRSATRKPDPKCEQKKAALAQLFFGLCFALRKPEDYDKLCAERKRLRFDRAICEQTGFSKSFVSRMIGDSAVLSGTADPVASFWREVFMNQEKFDLFDEWVRPNVLQKQRLGPEKLKEELTKFMGLKAVNAARKVGISR